MISRLAMRENTAVLIEVVSARTAAGPSERPPARDPFWGGVIACFGFTCTSQRATFPVSMSSLHHPRRASSAVVPYQEAGSARIRRARRVRS